MSSFSRVFFSNDNLGQENFVCRRGLVEDRVVLRLIIKLKLRGLCDKVLSLKFLLPEVVGAVFIKVS